MGSSDTTNNSRILLFNMSREKRMVHVTSSGVIQLLFRLSLCFLVGSEIICSRSPCAVEGNLALLRLSERSFSFLSTVASEEFMMGSARGRRPG